MMSSLNSYIFILFGSMKACFSFIFLKQKEKKNFFSPGHIK